MTIRALINRPITTVLMTFLGSVLSFALHAADFPELKQQIDSTPRPLGTGTCTTTRTGVWLAEGGVIVEIQKPKGKCDFVELQLVVNGEPILLTSVDDSFYSRRVNGKLYNSWYRGDSGKVFFSTTRKVDHTQIQGVLEVGCTSANCLNEATAISTTAQTPSQMKLAIQQPGADVPASCARFVGGWTGTWPFYGQTWFWVAEVDANCVAKCAARTSPAFPDAFQTCEIKGDLLTRKKPDGLEYYEMRGDELWARFVGSQNNNTVFRKFQPSEK